MAATDAKTQDPNLVKDVTPKDAPEADFPAAGPHAKPDLTDASKTPGAGMLTDPERQETDAPGG